jgi:plasmid maintenance system antidote protein VapI
VFALVKSRPFSNCVIGNFSMAKTHKRPSHPARTFEADLAEYWSSFAQEVRDELKAAIAERGISQDELSALLGKDPALISRILSGRNNLTLITMCEIAQAIGYRPELRLRKMTSADRRSARQAAIRRSKERDTSNAAQ